MAERVLTEFIKALRGAGVSVSTAESLDALRVADLTGYDDRARLRQALGMALAKSEADKWRYYQCFDDFFRFVAPRPPASSEPPGAPPASDPPPPQPGNAGASAGGGGGGEGQSDSEVSDLARLLEQDDPARLSQRMAAAVRTVDLTRLRVITQKGLFARRVMLAMGGEALDQDIFRLEAQHDPRGLALRRARDALRQTVIEEVNRQFLLQARETGAQLREQTMREVNLRDLAEFRDVQALVQRMAQRLVTLHGRRQRSSRKGLLDARRTLVSSIRHDAVPARLHWKSRRLRKPKLFVICDVSSSVASASRFLLMFLHAVNSLLPRVRSFAFASRCGEVSALFAASGDADTAIARILSEYAGSGTDYGDMLRFFWRTCEADLDRQSTVIVLGDARNNDLPAEQTVLRQIAERSRQVLWLNPEGRNRWGSGDSVMPQYLPYCRRAMPCRNLNQMERFVDSLLRDLR
ncbi:VWA domain-containing protein [Isoalcanivorax indicus]|uniref:VWA domain-containing protein n=1 Tax=Isoalcanivorax indicus TaxID=2202653 RepID=UPI000DBAB9A3|nr:VWA domain-containing protein [Isoalcanivorax indicus]